MIIEPTRIEGVLVIKPDIHSDNRGFFTETYSYKRYFDCGIKDNFVQDNYSHSKLHTIRGLHYQLKHPQAKLVRVIKGSVLDTALDIRVGSPTFGNSVTIELNDKNLKQLYLPEGIAHGFLVTSQYVDFEYKCSDYYFQNDQHGVLYTDPNLDLVVDSEHSLISPQDKSFKPLNQIPMSELPSYSPPK